MNMCLCWLRLPVQASGGTGCDSIYCVAIRYLREVVSAQLRDPARRFGNRVRQVCSACVALPWYA